MKHYIQVTVGPLTALQCDVLIAEMSAIGFYAFESEADSVTGYVREEDFDESACRALVPAGRQPQIAFLEEKNWNEAWESSFQPVIVGNFAGIRASFHPPVSGVRHEVIITPKMSFGTGHHATTWLMIEALQDLDVAGKSVLDFGTGTGVLAILAEKMGARSVTAVDIDPWSIRNAAENLSVNGCRGINLLHRDNIRDVQGVDIIMANINRDVLLENARDLASALRERASVLLASGLLEGDREAVEQRFRACGMRAVAWTSREGWIRVLFEKQ